MKRLLLVSCIVILISCERKTPELAQSDDGISEDSIVRGVLKFEDTGDDPSGNMVLDSLRWYMRTQTPMSKSFHKTIYGGDLSSVDKVYVSDILKSVNSVNPVITVFNTVESD